MRTLRAILRLARIDSSFLAFLAILVPLFVSSGEFLSSLQKAVPMLFISICMYVANDLDDLEKDRMNHPNRPLPAGDLTPTFCAILYFVFLGLALLSTRYYVAPHAALLYYLFIIVVISYRFVVEYIPVAKAIYVAFGTLIPVFIIAAWYPDKLRLYTVAGATFFHILGREICMNILDRPADPVSIMHRFAPTRLASFGFSLNGLGLLLLVNQIRNVGHLVNLLFMTIFLGLSVLFWFKRGKYRLAITMTKIEMFLGLGFLA